MKTLTKNEVSILRKALAIYRTRIFNKGCKFTNTEDKKEIALHVIAIEDLAKKIVFNTFLNDAE